MTKSICTRVVLCTKYKISCLKYIFITSVPKKQEHFTNELWSFYATLSLKNKRTWNKLISFEQPTEFQSHKLHQDLTLKYWTLPSIWLVLVFKTPNVCLILTIIVTVIIFFSILQLGQSLSIDFNVSAPQYKPFTSALVWVREVMTPMHGEIFTF